MNDVDSLDPALAADLLSVATRAAARAAAFLVEGWAGREVVSTKSSGTDVVTQMDRGSESLLVESIVAERPKDSLRGEEGGSRDGSTGITWVIDPLDGTVNYLYGLPVWAVSVGVLHGDQPIVGVVHAPALGSVWRGVALPQPMAELNGTPIAASRGRTLQEALVGTGFGYRADVREQQGRIVAALLPRVRDIRRAGAAAVDLCWVAQGLLDAYYERGTHLWDRAAGTAIATAAGARVGGIDGGPATDSMTIAAGAHLYEPLREQLTELGVT
jgi:myo-inositol-1(or 4)-monophosphatase